MKIGFIGLGVMGNPMAQNLLRSGQHELSVLISIRLAAKFCAHSEREPPPMLPMPCVMPTW